MREKDNLHTTLRSDRAPYRSGGLSMSRIYLPQRVHAGPKPTIGRDVILVMDPGEIMNLVVNLVGQLSPKQLLAPENSKHVEMLKKYLRITDRDTPSEGKT